MTYIDGFVLPVPIANKDRFTEFAAWMDAIFLEHGGKRIFECWAENVEHGKQTDFYRAVQATEDETVVFSWIEWPDKATRDSGMAELHQIMQSDPRFDPKTNPPPLDGKRMIFGGFEAIVEEGDKTPSPYVQGFIVPVPHDRREDYRKMAQDAWPMFRDFGAIRVIEAWGDDVPEGEVTDFRRSVDALEDENVVFSFLEWPSREVCDAAQEKMMADERMEMPEGFVMPFDGKRMVYGGFTPIVALGE